MSEHRIVLLEWVFIWMRAFNGCRYIQSSFTRSPLLGEKMKAIKKLTAYILLSPFIIGIFLLFIPFMFVIWTVEVVEWCTSQIAPDDFQTGNGFTKDTETGLSASTIYAGLDSGNYRLDKYWVRKGVPSREKIPDGVEFDSSKLKDYEI